MTQNLHRGRLQLIIVIIFIIASFSAAKILHATREPIQRKDVAERLLFVEIEKILPLPHRINFNVSGILRARSNVQIVPEVSGKIMAMNEQFFEGGSFKADDILFKIDPRNFAFEVKRLQAQVAAAKTQFDLEKAESKAAIAEWKQMNSDEKISDLAARRPYLLEAKSNLDAAKAQLGLAQLNLQRTEFRMPFDGQVLTSELAEGQYVVAGQNYGETFDVKSLEAKASLKDQQLKWLLAAQNPKITIRATYSGEQKEYSGVLNRSASFLDEKTRFAGVSFGITEPIENLLPGAFLDINIQGASIEGVMSVPINALQKEGNIWVLDQDNNLESVMPEIIYSDDEKMIIKAIRNEQLRIVTSYIAGAETGMKVGIIQ